ncbi:MAG: PPC domain-containing protein [Akkermansiaceae bacterium]
MLLHKIFCGIALLAFLSSTVSAFTPELGVVLPRGGTRGTQVEINLYGKRMHEPQEIIFYKPGITVTSLKKVSEKHIKAKLNIAPGASLGEYPLRLRCKGGITYMRTFWVGQFPVVNEKEPNNDFAAPQSVPMNHTIHGTAGIEDVDYFRVTAKKGQRISAEVEGMRLGHVFFDPYVAIMDSRRFELATSDDTSLHRQDPFVSIAAPADGEYIIVVRESSYEGNDDSRYRLHIGHFSRPTAVFPPAATPGQEASFQMIGDPTGNYTVTATPSGQDGGTFPLFAQRDGLLAPSPNPIRISSLPSTNEAEPNNDSKNASATSSPAPCAFNGIIDHPNDLDWFRFTAKKGQRYRIRVLARSLRSPLDSVMILRDAKGKHISRADDQSQGSLDSAIDFNCTADGEYLLNVRDHLRKGGPDYIYRIEIEPRKPSLVATLPTAQRNDSQKRKPIIIPRGNRYATVVNVTRSNNSADCRLEAPNLPLGVRLLHTPIPKSTTTFLAFFEADPDAPVAGGLYPFALRDIKQGSSLSGPLQEVINHIEINNTGVFHATTDTQLAVAVTEEAPFHIDLHTPPVPIVRSGTAQLKVTARRAAGFDGEIKVVLPWKSPGIGAPTQVVIPKGKTEAFYGINASGDAALGQFQICVTAESNTKKGPVMVSSSLVTLHVSQPFVTASIDMASTIPGEDVPLVCKLTHHAPFDGSAQIILYGLPHGVKAEQKSINTSTKEVIFNLQVAANAPKGNHNTIFCQILPKRNGHAIPHSTGQGGTLRINPPPPKPKVAAAKAPEKKAVAKKPAVKKPLSRLEQLRQRRK